MPESLAPQDRLQPALLDRLTDEEPDKKLEPRERRVLTRSQFRQAVLRDLAWMFNATRLESGADFANAPHARKSVVNFGLPAFSGVTSSALDLTEFGRAIRQAILDFEPRILPGSLRVKTLADPGQLDRHNIIGVEIQGQLWSQPVPLDLLVRTEIDLETGKVEIADLAPSRRA